MKFGEEEEVVMYAKPRAAVNSTEKEVAVLLCSTPRSLCSKVIEWRLRGDFKRRKLLEQRGVCLVDEIGGQFNMPTGVLNK